MKKNMTLLATSLALLTLGQVALADDPIVPVVDPSTTLCKSISDLNSIPLTSVMKGPGNNRYNVASDYQYDVSPDYSTYTAWQLMINGVKAMDAQDAIDKAKIALMNMTGSPTLQPDTYGYGFVCNYPIDFTSFGDDYNGVFPVASLTVSGTDYDMLLMKRKITKIHSK